MTIEDDETRNISAAHTSRQLPPGHDPALDTLEARAISRAATPRLPFPPAPAPGRRELAAVPGALAFRSRPLLGALVYCSCLLTASACSSTVATPAASPQQIARERAETARTLLEAGRALAAHGDSLRAEQYLRAALAAGAPPPEAVPLLIAVCVQSQRYRAAISDAREFLRQHPNASRLRFVLASLLAGLGDVPGAVDELTRLVSIEPDHDLGHYALAVLYRDRLHHAEHADREFRAYLDLAPGGPHAEEARASLLRPVRAID